MRWLKLLLVAFAISVAGQAWAMPQPDAEEAYARGDYATAFRLWLPLAEQGSPRAQINIARLYERGEGVAQDKAAATEWYRKAEAQGVSSLPAEPGTPMPVGYQGQGTTPYPTVSPYPVMPRRSQPAIGWSIGFRHGHSRH